MTTSDHRAEGPREPSEPREPHASSPRAPALDAPPEASRGASAPLDAEAQRAFEEARHAFLLAVEKAAIAARSLSSQVRAGAAEATEELVAIARAAHDRVRELAGEEGPPLHGATTHPARRSAASASRIAPHLAGALAYAGWAVTGVAVYLLTDRRERFVRFHALQSILLTVALGIVTGAVFAVPLVGRALFTMAASGFVLVWLLAMRKAFRGERYPLPFIGEIARAHVDREPGPKR